MFAELFRRAGPQPVPSHALDPAFAARLRLLSLRDALARAAKRLRSARWNEPAAFFFDPTRQRELEAARPAPPARFAALAGLVAAEMPSLLAHVEVRRIARVLDGLAPAALALAPHCAAANDLADLLAVPDDEVFLALAPNDRTGVRLHVRGAAGVAQLQRLLAQTRNDVFQLFAPAALLPDGTLPGGVAECGHWLWPTQPLAMVPRVRGERVVLVGPAVTRAAPESDPRFPGMAVESEVVQVLNPFQVADALSRLAGRPVPVAAPTETQTVARAA